MHYLTSLALIFCSLLFASTLLAQSSRLKRPEITSANVRLIKSKPHLFISFQREGQSSPLYEGDSNRRVWLRLNNNSKWSIMFCAGPIDKEYGELEVVYQLEGVDSSVNLPSTRSSDTCGYRTLRPGKSILFSIPREHLADGLAIRIRYVYQWELDADGVDDKAEPEHFSYFYSNDIPRK